VRPRYRRNLRARYEATILDPRAKQAPRRTQVRWYPTHGYQHDQPSQLQAPSLPVARAPTMKASSQPRCGPRAILALDSGSHINARGQRPEGEQRETRSAALRSQPVNRHVNSRSKSPLAIPTHAHLYRIAYLFVIRRDPQEVQMPWRQSEVFAIARQARPATMRTSAPTDARVGRRRMLGTTRPTNRLIAISIIIGSTQMRPIRGRA